MTKYDYKRCGIAIGWLVAAREAISKAQTMIELNFGDEYNKDFNKVWCIVNGIVAALNEEPDCETPTKKEDQ